MLRTTAKLMIGFDQCEINLIANTDMLLDQQQLLAFVDANIEFATTPVFAAPVYHTSEGKSCLSSGQS